MIQTEAYFNNIQATLIGELKAAKRSIYVAVAWFTDTQLFDVLIQKLQEGVSVSVVIIKDDINDKSWNDYDRITQNGGQFFTISDTLMHNKFCVIDERIIVTGSYNWTYKAATKNLENITVIYNDYDLALKFIQQFRHIIRQQSQKQIDNNRIVKRLNVVKNLILLEDEESLGSQMSKLKAEVDITIITEIAAAIQQRHFSDAVDLIETFITQNSRDPEYWLKKVREALNREAWTEAVFYGQKALFYEATSVKADIVLAYAFGRLRDKNKSLFYIERVDRLGEVEAEVYRSLLSTLELYFLSVFFGVFYKHDFADKLEKIAEPIKLDFSREELSDEQLVKTILENPDAHYLNLEKNKLSSLPKEIGQLTNLSRLNLSFNQLKSLPKEIGQLTNLTSLVLRWNKLSSLPKEIGQLTNLTSLSLWANQLSSLPKEIGQLTNLTSLSLWINRLSTLPKEIGQLTNLTSLSLRKNQLSSLPREIGQLPNLTSLDLSINPDLDFKNTFQILKELSNLTSLDLSWNQLNSLPKEIIQLTNLTYLDLRGNNFSASEKERIKSLLPNCNIRF